MLGLTLWLAATAGDVGIQERVVLERNDLRIVEDEPIAPTGLPIAARSRRLVRGGDTLWVRAAPPIDARRWSAPARTDAEVRGLAEAAGYRVQAVHAEHRPHDGSVRWRVDVAFDPATGTRPFLWIDDVSGALRRGVDRVRNVDASAYRRNPVLDPEPEIFVLEGIDDPQGGLVDGTFDVRQCGDPGGLGNCILEPVPPTMQNDFVFEAPQSDEDHASGTDLFAAASVAVHAQRFVRFTAEHGLPLPPCLEDDAPGIVLVNYRGFTGEDEIRVANAGYTGDCSLLAFFGQGASADWGYDADVVLHELTHGTIDAYMGDARLLGRVRRRPDAVVNDAGAINEALADFVAAVVAGDPEHAEYVRSYEGGSMRSADNDLQCPQDLIGAIHFDGEPLTGALWEAHEAIGDDLVQPVLDAVAMLEEDATFEEVSAIMLVLTEDAIGADARDILATALDRHGLLDCARVARIEDVRGPLSLPARWGAGGSFDPMRPPLMQVRVDVPEDAVSMTVTYGITVVPEPGWDPVGDVHVLVRAGGPTTFTYETNDDGITVVDADSDLHVPSANEGAFTVEVAPGEPVYLAFFNQGLHMTRVGDLAVEFEVGAGSSGSSGEAPGTGTGTGTGAGTGGAESSGDSGEADGDGGGCRVGGRSSWDWLLLLLGASSLLRGRTSRRRRYSGGRGQSSDPDGPARRGGDARRGPERSA